MSDDVRGRLIAEVAAVVTSLQEALVGPLMPGSGPSKRTLREAAAIVDALGLVTDRRLRVLTEEGRAPDRAGIQWSDGFEWKCFDGNRYTFHFTLEAAVAAAWEARGS